MVDVAELGIKVTSTGVREAKDGLDNLATSAGKVQAAAGSTSKVAGALGSALGALAGTVVGAAAGFVSLNALLQQTRAAMALGDEIGDTAAKIAISTDALQEYRYAVKALGGEYKDADAALQGFSRAFGSAQAGLSKRALKPFEALGLDPKTFKTTEEALEAVTDKIANLKSSAEQAAIAERLGLTPMLVALRAGGDEIENMKRQAHELGVVMDADLVKRAGEANDKFETMSQVVDVQLKSALVDLGPVLVGLAGLVADLARGVGAIVDGLRAVEEKSLNGLRNQRASVASQAADLGLRIMSGQALGDADKRRLADMNAMLTRLDNELASRAIRDVSAPSGSGSLKSLVDDLDEGVSKTKRMSTAEREAAAAAREFESALLSVRNGLKGSWASAADEATASMATLIKGYDEGKVSADELAEANLKLSRRFEEVAASIPEVSGELQTLEDRLGMTADETRNLQTQMEYAAEVMSDAFNGVANSVDDLFRSIAGQDWGRAASSLIGAFKGVSSSMSSVGLLGTIGNVAGSISPYVGGTAGKALSALSAGGQLGALGGMAGLLGTGSAGLLGGTTITPMVLQSALGSTIAGTVGTAGGLSGALSGIGGALATNPIGWAIAGVALVATLFGGNKKPSNNGALATLDGDSYSLSGSKRNEQTSKLATTAAEAILAGQKLLSDAGITLAATVKSIDIGTRDATDIILSDGRALTSAVGDAAAAAETALLAVLDGATYADDAQKSLVESMKAAGSGFDDIVGALGQLKAAMEEAASFGQSIAAQIAQLKNPDLYGVTSLAAAQDARYAQVDAYLAGGALTKAQADAQRTQLAELDNLELGALMTSLSDKMADLTGTSSAASEANSAAASAARDAAQSFGALAKSLRDYSRALGSNLSAVSSPLAAFGQAQGAFRGISGNRSLAGLERLQGLGEAYVSAASAVAPDRLTLARVMAEVRNEVSSAADYAEGQATIAEQQLTQLQAINKTGAKDTSVLAVAAAISALGTLMVQKQINGTGSGFTEAPSWFNAKQYLADNKDLARNFASGGILAQYGSLEEAALAHFLGAGQYEIATGKRKYANGTDYAAGGISLVGERGPELLNIPRGGQVIPNATLAKMAGATDEETKALLRQLVNLMASQGKSIADLEQLWRGLTPDGQSIQTIAA